MKGDVYLADLSPSRGSEQAGIRPVVIVQRDSLARFTRTVVVVPMTSNLRRSRIPGTVVVSAGEGGLERDSVVLCYQIAVIDRQRLQRKLGKIEPSQLLEIDEALKYTLELDDRDGSDQPGEVN